MAKKEVIDVEAIRSVAPQTINETRRVRDRLCLAGQGKGRSPVMFVASAVSEEEVAEDRDASYAGIKIRTTPRFLKGPAGTMFKDVAMSAGIDIEEGYYTGLCRWLIPKNERAKPKPHDIHWGAQMLEYELGKVKPRVVVALGKPAFDFLSDVKLAAKDLDGGGFFYSSKFNCMVYPMPDTYRLVSKPEQIIRFRDDLVEINRMLKDIDGTGPPRIPLNYRTITTAAQLQALMAELAVGNFTVISPDCEWGGTNHVDGDLRSIQLAWKPGYAVYVKFRDETGKYVFDVDYKVAGAIMGQWLDQPMVKYVGHHISADLPWMHHILGLKWYQKCLMDTEFAVQTLDEYADLGLERLALKYTDLGRYDLELVMWKKLNKMNPEDGYAHVPDAILEPYGCKDVDVCIRAYPHIQRMLESQKLTEYYNNILHPFVTDVFTNFAIEGLPMDIPKMDELRTFFQYTREQMEILFKEQMHEEARGMLRGFVANCLGGNLEIATSIEANIHAMVFEHGTREQAFEMLKKLVPVKDIGFAADMFEHYEVSKVFNIRAVQMMRKWLFTLKGYTPIKSTNNKEAGLPSVAWERVMALPADRQREFTPSTDKQTLQILSVTYSDPMLDRLLELNAVGNLCKAFLKEPTLDEDTGEVTRENGLHYWVAEDMRVHGQTSTTETGRPRAWKPNILNWPKFINGKIKAGVKRTFETLDKLGTLDPRFRRYLEDEKSIPTIRSATVAIPDWIFVESDYQTAEVRGLGFIAGDAALIKALIEPDDSFGKWSKDDKVQVRLFYREDSPINPPDRDPKFLRSVPVKTQVPGVGETIEWKPIPDEELLAKDGKLAHPKNDLHWSLAERVHSKPREILDEDKDRGSAKITRFSSVYGAAGATVERKIESDTGIKPEPGSGDLMLEALAALQPDAEAFLVNLEDVVKDPGYYRAASGRLRRFMMHPDNVSGQIANRTREGMYGSMGRELRNFPFQESVASSLARGMVGLLELAMNTPFLQGRPIIGLYDAVDTHCPLEERFVWAKAHTLFMFRKTGWFYHGRVLTYPIDTDFCKAWSTKLPKDELTKVKDRSYYPATPEMNELERKLDEQIEYLASHEMESVYNVEDMRDYYVRQLTRRTGAAVFSSNRDN